MMRSGIGGLILNSWTRLLFPTLIRAIRVSVLVSMTRSALNQTTRGYLQAHKLIWRYWNGSQDSSSLVTRGKTISVPCEIVVGQSAQTNTLELCVPGTSPVRRSGSKTRG